LCAPIGVGAIAQLVENWAITDMSFEAHISINEFLILYKNCFTQ